MTRFNDHFFGHKISDYGLENKRVDYHTFASAFDAVCNNDIMTALEVKGFYFEQVSGWKDNSDEIEELTDTIDTNESALEDIESELETATGEKVERLLEEKRELEEENERLEERRDELEAEQNYLPEIFQLYIIDDNGAEICKEFGEIVYYCEDLDMYLWGVTHWGTSWDYVLTDIPCGGDEE